MIYRSAVPDDGSEMLRLIESHPASGGIKILYTRRPDAYQSYLAECPDAEITVCVNDDNRVLAQIVCLPRKMYINREAQIVGYVTGLHKEEGAVINILKLLEAGHSKSTAKHFFCSILDDNKPAYNLFSKHKIIRPICDYRTYFIHPAALKPPKHNFNFRRVVPDDAERLIIFYNEVGIEYSYFPLFETMNDFTGLKITDFFLLEDGDKIIAAGALWNQRTYKQYIALGYHGINKLASGHNPLLRLLRYPALPKINTAANFAYISFMLYRKDNLDTARIFLGEIASAARGYDFITIGAVSEDKIGMLLNSAKNIKIGSKLCRIDYHKNSPEQKYKTPFWFECALL